MAAAVVAIGLVLAGVALVGLRHDRGSPTSFGSLALRPASLGPATRAPAPETRASSERVSGGARATSARSTRPVLLRIPALGLTAPVERVVTSGGVLGVPDDVGHVGWWVGSALPGSPAGATVIDGHVDSAVEGDGALFRVGDLRVKQRVTLTTENGRQVGYRVFARRVYSKTRALPTTLFDTVGAPRLVLITCGGPFDPAAHSYRDNIAVFARPVT
ncbi:class F sortase [uncultured Jatrophihabitans sp.]|uniref:class F sortase n=1 Tax=uncultured Jatrophihabitans sp. TaxID=1610747 RepID=UPI0035C97BAD